ncbi:MAG: hypothetical protein H2174_07625 [Vampirovibrio sp.]|nr:hypothetical protein [Vampirovibrio sp.]
MTFVKKLVVAVLFCTLLVPNAFALTDSQIKQRLVSQSINNYSGNCACPYNTARNGSSCGRRSAYSRDGGETPLCYASDVSTSMVRQYRKNH